MWFICSSKLFTSVLYHCHFQTQRISFFLFLFFFAQTVGCFTCVNPLKKIIPVVLNFLKSGLSWFANLHASRV